MNRTEVSWLITNHGEANQILDRVVWSSPQMDSKRMRVSCCSSCRFFADTGARVSSLNLNLNARDGTFGFCQNVRIWAAFGKEKPPITRSYHYCNYYKEKEDGNRR